MTIKTINKNTSHTGFDWYSPGFYGAHKIVMPEEGWINKVGGVSRSDSAGGGEIALFLTTQATPGTGGGTVSLLWAGSTVFTVPGDNTARTFEESAPNIHVISGQEIWVVMYSVSGDARMCYESSAGNEIYDGPYAGGPVPPTIPLTDKTFYSDYRYAQWIEYDDTNPGSAGGKPKVYSGSSWAEKPLKVHNGSSWVEKPLKVHNGSTWVLV